MPKKEIVQVNPAAANPNLSPATKLANLVFVSGQTGRHPVTGEVGKDIREQTRNVLERIKQILAAAGTSMDNVLTATTYVTRRDDVPAYNEEYAKYFPDQQAGPHDRDGGVAELARAAHRDHRHGLHSELTRRRQAGTVSPSAGGITSASARASWPFWSHDANRRIGVVQPAST